MTLAEARRICAYHDACAAVLRLGGWIWEELQWVDLIITHGPQLWPQPGELGMFRIHHYCECCDPVEHWLPGGGDGWRDYLTTELQWLNWLRDLEAVMWEHIEDEWPDLEHRDDDL